MGHLERCIGLGELPGALGHFRFQAEVQEPDLAVRQRVGDGNGRLVAQALKGFDGLRAELPAGPPARAEHADAGLLQTDGDQHTRAKPLLSHHPILGRVGAGYAIGDGYHPPFREYRARPPDSKTDRPTTDGRACATGTRCDGRRGGVAVAVREKREVSSTQACRVADQGFEDRLQVECGGKLAIHGEADLEGICHLIEGAGQAADLVLASGVDPLSKISAGDRGGALGQRANRPSQPAGLDLRPDQADQQRKNSQAKNRVPRPLDQRQFVRNRDANPGDGAPLIQNQDRRGEVVQELTPA